MKIYLYSFFLLNFTLTFAQTSVEVQLKNLDFKNVDAQIAIAPETEIVEGKVSYIFEVLQEVDSFFLDAQNMEFSEVKVNGNPVETSVNDTAIWIKETLEISNENQLSLNYKASPKQAMYFINWEYPDDGEIRKQVWTQGQGKKSSHWLPVIDNQNEKAIFNLDIDFNRDYKVLANGELILKENIEDSRSCWQFEMEDPMSSYLLAIAAGDFQQENRESASGIALELYMDKKDSAYFEPTYRHSVAIFDFLEEEIGVAYPWQNYKQVPVQDFLYSGMENTGATIFSRLMLTDSIGYKDRNYISVNAHELAHQWFGNLVTQKSPKHHWLHEGFATYYALLAEREIFGDDHYYWKLYQSAEKLKELSDTGKGEALAKTGGSSLTYYQKGAWALHVLRERIGDENFNKAVKDYLELYAFQNVETADFITEAERVSGQDLSEFVANWLNQTAFQGAEALNSLRKSKFITDYLELAGLRETGLADKADFLKVALNFPVNDYIGQEVVFQLEGHTSQEAIKLYKKAFESGNPFVRQAIALSMDEIPQELKAEYESLLEDESWLTREAALTNLWMQFPNENVKYLEKTKDQQGFSDKNLRILGLTLNLATPAFQPEKQDNIYKELSGYTAAHNPFEIRENAFGYLYQINAFSDQNLKDLMQGTRHHTTRFRDYCRQLLSELLKTPQYRERFQRLKGSLPENQQDFLDLKLQQL